MTAYLFAKVEVIEPDPYEEYRRLVPAVIATHGGRYLVRGGRPRYWKATSSQAGL